MSHAGQMPHSSVYVEDNLEREEQEGSPLSD